VKEFLLPIAEFLSWFALPVGLIAMVDDWFLRPRRQIAAAPQPARDPPFMAVLYYALPVLIAAAVVRLLMAERLDFSVVLLLIAVVTGVIWLVDVAILRRMREAAARQAGKDPEAVPEPGTVDYARSFFPVAVVVLALRSFVFEPFRIPSDSMMPTLLDGDFIIVNKFTYGLRLPVVNTEVVPMGEPQRGDVVVFRFPKDPSMNYIKRLAGMPGDRVAIRNDQLLVNGEQVPIVDRGIYGDGCYEGMRLAAEKLGAHEHLIMYCSTPGEIQVDKLPSCNRDQDRSYVCTDSQLSGFPDKSDTNEDILVPPGHYLMIGDNRDNSQDGRWFGVVPRDHLVGKATRIWFNWDLQRSGGPIWGRIGDAIE
jgi:signal peptidase I